jgi:hypothetical protein
MKITPIKELMLVSNVAFTEPVFMKISEAKLYPSRKKMYKMQSKFYLRRLNKVQIHASNFFLNLELQLKVIMWQL